MRADNRRRGRHPGADGAGRARSASPASAAAVAAGRRSGLFGAALLYGDGMITPAISVLSAVEGLEVATPVFQPYVIPITVVILIGAVPVPAPRHRRRSARSSGRSCWSGSRSSRAGHRRHRAAAGACSAPSTRSTRFDFFVRNGLARLPRAGRGLPGGHRRRGALRRHGPLRRRPDPPRPGSPSCCRRCCSTTSARARCCSRDPAAVAQPVLPLAPDWALYPLVVLATAATVIASQAVISGAFSLTRQAVQLGYCPRLKIDHTSAEEIGQIYMPPVNWLLMVGDASAWSSASGSSSNLAAAYGVAVTTTMVITTVLLLRRRARAAGAGAAGAPAPAAGRLPGRRPGLLRRQPAEDRPRRLVPARWWRRGVFTLMATWKRGRQILRRSACSDGVAGRRASSRRAASRAAARARARHRPCS